VKAHLGSFLRSVVAGLPLLPGLLRSPRSSRPPIAAAWVGGVPALQRPAFAGRDFFWGDRPPTPSLRPVFLGGWLGEHHPGNRRPIKKVSPASAGEARSYGLRTGRVFRESGEPPHMEIFVSAYAHQASSRHDAGLGSPFCRGFSVYSPHAGHLLALPIFHPDDPSRCVKSRIHRVAKRTMV